MGDFLQLPLFAQLAPIAAQLGSIRNLWEGNFCGEGYIRMVKPEMVGGFRQDWNLHLLNRLMLNRAVMHLRGGPTKKKKSKYSDLHVSRYKDVLDARGQFGAGRVLSGVEISGSFYLVMDNLTCLEIMRRGDDSRVCYNNWYYLEWELAKDLRGHPIGKRVTRTSVSRYLIFLPNLDEKGNPKERERAFFTVITNEWERIGKDGGFHSY